MNHIKDSLLEGMDITLAAANTRLQIARSVIRECVVTGNVPASGLTVVDAEFDRCKIKWKKPLVNMSWLATRFKWCTFEGKFLSNRFGHMKEEGPRSLGSVEDCDFSHAELHGSDFINCDMPDIHLPSWPCFTLLYPAKFARDLQDQMQRCPKALKTALEVTSKSSSEVAAVVWSAMRLAKEDLASLETLRTYIAGLPGVHLQSAG